MSLDKNAKIYIAGHHGLVGSAIWNNLEKRGYHNLVGRSHKELDLTDQYAVEKFIVSCRLHHAEHEDAVQRDQQRLFSWRKETPLPGLYLHLSKECTTANE